MPRPRPFLRSSRIAPLALVAALAAGCTLEEAVREADRQTGQHLQRSTDVESDRVLCPENSYWEMSRMR